jgi:hypothetical protein
VAADKLTPDEKRQKHADYMREYVRNSPVQLEKSRARAREWRRRDGNIERERANKNRWRAENPEANHAARVKWQRGSRLESDRRHGAIPAKRMCKLLSEAKKRAKKRQLEFDENLREVLRSAPPMECRCCSAMLEYAYTGTKKPHLRAPSLDRLVPAKGYTVENVRVICLRCNWVKSDATLAELETVAAYMRSAV